MLGVMFEHFTINAIKTIMLAQEEARRLGHNRVGTEQILLVLLGVSGRNKDVEDPNIHKHQDDKE
jgi:hypothetical protein